MTDLKTSDFDYDLPENLIAQEPSQKRDHSRLMVLNRKEQTIEHKLFKDIIDYLVPGDVLVINDTKVLPANIVGRKAEGTARIEVLLVSPRSRDCLNLGRLRQPAVRDYTWTCLVKPGKRLKIGSKIIFSDNLTGTVLEKLETGEQVIEFDGNLQGFMRKHGELPLPPYIRGARVKTQGSRIGQRYQTVYAEKEGATAAPTAGLHFTPELLEQIKNKGIHIAKVTLHTGLGTFKPVYAEYIKDHKMFEEYYEVPEGTICAMSRCNIGTRRVVAVGTTSVRTLETIAERYKTQDTRYKEITNYKIQGSTEIFIYPGFKFQVVDAMVTNFHIPKSTLMMLVSAFAGRDFILRAYKEAIEKNYRFFSFGDAMLIL